MSKNKKLKFAIKFQRKFSRSSDYSEFAMVRVHNFTVSNLGGSGAWVKIQSLDDRNKFVYRVIRGHGKDDTFSQDAIEMDYQTSKNHLGISTKKTTTEADQKEFYPCNLEITPADSVKDLFLAHWMHPDPGYRFPVRISIVSLFLGITGLFLGLISLIS